MYSRAARPSIAHGSTPQNMLVATRIAPSAARKNPVWSHFARPLQTKSLVNTPGDRFEQEADRIADHVVRAPAIATAAAPVARAAGTAPIQRDEDKTGAVLSEGASLAYDQAKEQPGFEAWQKRQTDALKLKLWDNQPAAFKAGIIGFGLGSAGLLGTVFAADPRFRATTIDTLQDINLLLPLSLLPYSEYFPVSSFKYKLPGAQAAPYTFETEFSFDPWFKLMQERWNVPEISLGAGVKSSYSQGQGFSPFSGGSFTLKLGGGIVNLRGFYDKPLPPTPMLISDPARGESPMWLMRSLPGQLEENLPMGSGVFLTVDVLRLPKLLSPQRETPAKIQRKAESAAGDAATADALPLVHDVLRSGQGTPLDTQTRQRMEGSFGLDFSQVRIHTGQQAAQSARSIHARAYTSGTRIVFGQGQYRPHTGEGQRLLAHELAHVVQQAGAGTPAVQRKLVVEDPATALPGTPARQHWEDIRDSLRTLSPDFAVNAAGDVTLSTPDLCKTPARTTDRCLCDMHKLADTWKIKIDDTTWPHTEEANKRVVVQSTRSQIDLGAWGTGAPGGQRIFMDQARILAHELCGHGWLMVQGTHPSGSVVTSGGRLMSRPSHDPTVQVENTIAQEVAGPAAPQRGLHTDPHSGESFGRVTVAEFPTGDAGVASLPAAMQARIDLAATFMTADANLRADILGHSDHQGSAAAIASIARQRARAVRDALVAKGVAATRFNIVDGRGDTECPAGTADNPACRKVEIFVYLFEKSSLRFP